MDAHLEGLRRTLEEACLLPPAFSERFLLPEAAAIERVRGLLDAAPLDAALVQEEARKVAGAARARAGERVSVDTFLREYSLGSEEGVLLMCLAEALIRIPDDDTARLLIEDKLGDADFHRHLGHSGSLLVNASTWGLLLTGRLFRPESGDGPRRRLRELVNRLGEGVALRAMRQAMSLVGEQFVVSRNIEEALARTGRADGGSRYSFDMLGEAAVSEEDAERYCASYLEAIEAVGGTGGGERLAVSIKLSALDARYEPLHRRRGLPRLLARLRRLAGVARARGVQLTIDAEEAFRLHLSLELFLRLYEDPLARGWGGLGLAVQAYQKRAPDVLDWLAALARRHGDRIPVRLVKGAYWDTEIKRAQVLGLDDYPVFVHKAATDVSWLACADRILAAGGALYGQFASHNAHSLCALLALARGRGAKAFEIQRLYGMGAALSEVLAERHPELPQRIYAPVGAHEALLPYLMRRLLENGANSSFVHHLSDPAVPIEELVRDPRTQLPGDASRPRAIPLPRDLYGTARRNSRGLNLDDERVLRDSVEAIAAARPRGERVAALIDGKEAAGEAAVLRCPFDRDQAIGEVRRAGAGECARALRVAADAFDAWRRTPVAERAACLERAADLLEEERFRFMALAVYEAGKTLSAALGEVREAVDYCRYYARLAREQLATPLLMPGPTGEENRLWLEGRGPFLAIAPWNFPLAIFTGQVAAALVAGNPVLAKPAEFTPLIAREAVRLLHRAGVPPEVLAFLPAGGRVVGEVLVPDPALAGIAFTGSTATARAIARTLAARSGPFIPFIAETGGQNALFVDSSALPEQAVRDILTSAFDSGGQRCSALRVLYVQEDIAEPLLALLRGAVELLSVGHPLDPGTDVGPVISAQARADIERSMAALDADPRARRLAAVPDSGFTLDPARGHFVRPAVYELGDLAPPPEEVFGPLLHVIRYRHDQFDAALAAVRRGGYALTGGVHSRIDSRVRHVESALPLGNLYVNRSIIGAVVGTQPFGGFGLSGTGPKAGGPHYLLPFCHERTTTINTAAVGGDTGLLSAGEPQQDSARR